MNIQEMAEQCLKDSDEWFPQTARDPMYMLMCMFGEVGEVANEFKKMMRDDTEDEDRLTRMKEEMIDVLIYWLCLASIMGIDIEREYNDKRAINAHRFGR